MAVLWKGPSWVEELRTAQNALAKLRLTFKEIMITFWMTVLELL